MFGDVCWRVFATVLSSHCEPIILAIRYEAVFTWVLFFIWFRIYHYIFSRRNNLFLSGFMMRKSHCVWKFLGNIWFWIEICSHEVERMLHRFAQYLMKPRQENTALCLEETEMRWRNTATWFHFPVHYTKPVALMKFANGKFVMVVKWNTGKVALPWILQGFESTEEMF